jgi:hypothetical protein
MVLKTLIALQDLVRCKRPQPDARRSNSSSTPAHRVCAHHQQQHEHAAQRIDTVWHRISADYGDRAIEQAVLRRMLAVQLRRPRAAATSAAVTQQPQQQLHRC